MLEGGVGTREDVGLSLIRPAVTMMLCWGEGYRYSGGCRPVSNTSSRHHDAVLEGGVGTREDVGLSLIRPAVTMMLCWREG